MTNYFGNPYQYNQNQPQFGSMTGGYVYGSPYNQQSQQNIWQQPAAQQTQQSGGNDMMGMMLMMSKMDEDFDMKEFMPLIMMQSMMSGGGNMMSMLPMLMKMNGEDGGNSDMMKEMMPMIMMSSMMSGGGSANMMSMLPMLMQMNSSSGKSETFSGEEGESIKEYAKTAGEQYDEFTLSEEFLSGKATGTKTVKFVENKKDMDKAEYNEALEGLAEAELEGISSDGEEITTEQYAKAKYKEAMKEYKALYDKGEINSKTYQEVKDNLEGQLLEQITNADFSYDGDEASMSRDGIVQKRDLMGMFGQLDYMGSKKYDGKFTSTEASGLTSALVGDSSNKVRQNIFKHQQELFE